MEPSNFDGSNSTADTPPGVSVDAVQPLRVCVDPENNQVVSCWKVTADELEEINRTGRVWLHVAGLQQPPVFVSGKDPFCVMP